MKGPGVHLGDKNRDKQEFSVKKGNTCGMNRWDIIVTPLKKRDLNFI